MRTFTLYRFLLASVLLLSACNPDDAANPTEPQASRTPPAVRADTTSTRADGDAPDAERARTILVLGNSLAAGYGIDPSQAFPALLQQRIDSLGWDFRVVNAGLSGETTAGGLRRLDWLLRQPLDVLILELGGNDGLRGIAPEVTRQNLEAIIEQTRARNPDVRIVLAGMQVPPNLGEAYTRAFRDLYPALATEKDVALVPFLLEGVGGVPDLNLPDGIHPTPAGHRIVARNVWDVLRPLLADLREQPA